MLQQIHSCKIDPEKIILRTMKYQTFESCWHEFWLDKEANVDTARNSIMQETRY